MWQRLNLACVTSHPVMQVSDLTGAFRLYRKDVFQTLVRQCKSKVRPGSLKPHFKGIVRIPLSSGGISAQISRREASLPC